MSRTAISLAALVVGAVVLSAAAWFDSVVMVDAQQQAARNFDSSWLAGTYALGSIAVGGACLAIGRVGWRAHALVGLLYAIVGGFFACSCGPSWSPRAATTMCRRSCPIRSSLPLPGSTAGRRARSMRWG